MFRGAYDSDKTLKSWSDHGWITGQWRFFGLVVELNLKKVKFSKIKDDDEAQ